MLKSAATLKVEFILVQLYNLNLILSVLDKRAEGHLQILSWFIAKIDCIEIEVRLISVDLFFLLLLLLLLLLGTICKKYIRF